MLLCASVLTSFLMRKLTDPLQKITDAAQRFGGGDFSVRVEGVEGEGEVVDLAHTFNQMAENIQSNDNSRGQFMGNIAHDLRTPLTLIKGYAETVRDLTGDDKAHRDEQMNIIVDETDRLTALVSSVMELSKVTSGADRCERVNFDMGQLCDEVSERYDAICAQNGWQLKLELPDEELPVYADPDMMQRALHNLLGNAMHHIGPDGIFILRASRCTEGVRVEVEDHGPGIAAAEDAIARLRAVQPDLALRSVTLTAKEKACLHPDAEGHPACLPEVCPYANGYYDRIKNALAALLDGSGQFSRAALADTARQFTVCPFELGLDLSEWCDVVIGDYNYLFDPVVHLKRFFDTSGDWLFLIDEAHNLPDRARAMYSARFCKSSLTDAKRTLGKGKSALKTALTKADKAMREARQACVRLAPRRHAEDAPGEPAQTSLLPESDAPAFALPEPLYAQDGTVFLQELPAALLTPLRAVQAPLQAWLEDNPEADAHPQMLELYFAVQDLVRATERYDSHFVTQLTARGSELELQLLCLDPAPFVDASLSTGRSAALFSATLTPPAYYRSVLGCADARAVALESPFPAGNLGLFCLPGISTRYRDRERSVQSVSDALARLAQSRVGNYLAFFPSYAYLRQVQEDFAARYPGISTLVQESGLDDAARAAFLARFEPDPAHTLLGFAVMGGIFGEGVDLAGDRLIGCAIVGVGLPQVNPRQEMLRRYYDAQNGAGFDYAYRYPGMNKVLQAAGRVIRAPEDKGVVLLLDDRFAKPDYQRLFPLHWKHLQYLPGPAALETALAAFWGSRPE